MAVAVTLRAELNRVLDGLADDDGGGIALAVSGGVDSMTLAVAAHARLGAERAEVFHAVSPAVPPEATARVRAYAERQGWRLRVIDAGEFADADYLRNPVNRCFFCKTNLYGTIARHTARTIASGTNLDDLGDYRPGLEAARNHGVRHPYVEAGIDKAGVRALARALGCDDVAELPAAPCLSSRLETGIAVDAATLAFVHAVERLIADELRPETVRCRVFRDGVAVQLDPDGLARVEGPAGRAVRAGVDRLCREHGRVTAAAGSRGVRFEAYRRGSAFRRRPTTTTTDGPR